MAELEFLRDNGPQGNPFRNDRLSVQAAFLRQRDDEARLWAGGARTCAALSLADVLVHKKVGLQPKTLAERCR
jgi:hypothetical protein